MRSWPISRPDAVAIRLAYASPQTPLRLRRLRIATRQHFLKKRNISGARSQVRPEVFPPGILSGSRTILLQTLAATRRSSRTYHEGHVTRHAGCRVVRSVGLGAKLLGERQQPEHHPPISGPIGFQQGELETELGLSAVVL
jgi:hypothetical protein